MSRIVDGDTSEGCKPWQAPQLDNGGAINHGEPDSTGHGGNANREQLGKLRKQAYAEAYAKGHAEGVIKGQKELNEQVKYLQSVIATLTSPLHELDNEVVDQLVQLCMAVVKQLVRRELKNSPGEVVAVVREALGLLPAAAVDVKLELHPDDARLIRDALTQPENESGWRIIEDPLLTRGGCRVHTSTSRIDATVEKRINSVITEVMGSERKVDSE